MGTPDARDRALIPQERVELASFTAENLRERGGVEVECVGPEVREIRVELRRRHEPDSGAFLLPRLRQQELVASCEPEPEHGRLRPLRSRCEVAESTRAHEVDAEHELPVLRGKEEVLAAAARALKTASLERRERRVERLQGGDVCGTGFLDRRARDQRSELAHPRLHLG